MRNAIISWLALTLTMIVACFIIPGIGYETLGSLIFASLVLGVLNTIIRPVLFLLSLPFILVTLGVFLIVINALLIMLTGLIVPGFYVSGFWPAAGASLIISIINLFIKGPKPQVQVRTNMNIPSPKSPEPQNRIGDSQGPPRGKGDIIDI